MIYGEICAFKDNRFVPYSLFIETRITKSQKGTNFYQMISALLMAATETFPFTFLSDLRRKTSPRAVMTGTVGYYSLMMVMLFLGYL